jgi:hypothetical protein
MYLDYAQWDHESFGTLPDCIPGFGLVVVGKPTTRFVAQFPPLPVFIRR